MSTDLTDRLRLSSQMLEQLACILRGEAYAGGAAPELVLAELLPELAGANGTAPALLRERLVSACGEAAAASILSQVLPAGPPPPRRAPKTVSAADLATMQIPPLQWAVRDTIPEGLGIMGGRPKMGKSWMLLQTCIHVAAGLPFIGRPVESGDVLYLGLEDGPRRLQGRQARLCSRNAPPRSLHLMWEWRRWDEGGDEDLDLWLSEQANPRLVVIDTWAKLAPPQKSRGDGYGETYQVLAGVQKLAFKHHVAIVLVMHTRKPSLGGDWLDDVMGSTGNTGPADVVLVLQRERESRDGTLHITGRDIEETSISAVLDPAGGWRLQSAHEKVDADPDLATVVQYVRKRGAFEGSASELVDLAKVDAAPNALSRKLNRFKSEMTSLGVEMLPCPRSGDGRRFILRVVPGDGI